MTRNAHFSAPPASSRRGGGARVSNNCAFRAKRYAFRRITKSKNSFSPQTCSVWPNAFLANSCMGLEDRSAGRQTQVNQLQPPSDRHESGGPATSRGLLTLHRRARSGFPSWSAPATRASCRNALTVVGVMLGVSRVSLRAAFSRDRLPSATFGRTPSWLKAQLRFGAVGSSLGVQVMAQRSARCGF